MIRVQANNIEYKHFKDAEVTLQLDSLANSFRFVAADPNSIALPIRNGDPIKITVEGITVIDGYAEITEVSGSGGQHTVTYEGRDKTGDIIDSSIDQISDMSGAISLKTVIESVLDNIGVSIKVIDRANPSLFKDVLDMPSPSPGEGAFNFIERMARRKQVILTCDESGNLVIESTPGGSTGAFLRNGINVGRNNILRMGYRNDSTERYRVYKFLSSLNPVTLNKTAKTSIDSVVKQHAAVVDTGIRAGRQLSLTSEMALDEEETKKRALWEANVRRSRARSYACTVLGYKPDTGGDIWRPNRLVNVIDAFAELNTEMLINTVIFKSNESGNTTDLELIERNAYSLTLQEPISQSGLGAI